MSSSASEIKTWLLGIRNVSCARCSVLIATAISWAALGVTCLVQGDAAEDFAQSLERIARRKLRPVLKD